MDGRCCLQTVFRTFVCVALTLLLGLQLYGYLFGPGDALDGDFTDVKQVVMQLMRGLTEVNRKDEQLRSEMARITAMVPSMAAAADRAKDALQPCSQQTFDVYQYDRQIADYALESAGARVLDTGDTVEHELSESPVGFALHVLTSVFCGGYGCLNARAMLRPGALPGECWAFKGHRGEATIRLLGTIHVAGISLEHIPAHISPTREISSAPRVFQLEGLEHRSDQYPHDFGSFEFDKEGKPIQYFEVRHPSDKGYNVVKFQVLSNWGHPVYTCVYRIRVHGELVAGQFLKTPSEDDLRIDNE